MSTKRHTHPIVAALLALATLLAPNTPILYAQGGTSVWLPLVHQGAAQVTTLPASDLLFRTQLTLQTPPQQTRLTQLGITILEQTADQAVVLADYDQLETLARLRYQPHNTVAFETLITANPEQSPWLAPSLQPLTDQLTILRRNAATTLPQAAMIKEAQSALTTLRTTVTQMSQEQRAALADLPTVDDDADNLTNAQEAWWCTDPLNADTDGDGANDGDEVQAAKEWLGNRRAGPPSTGRPFAGWPPSQFDPTKPPTCRDGDDDGVPDMAERWDLGLNMNEESTDRDKFDDGQELFGTTEWGRGALPRVQDDAGYIFAEMPTWVKAPGNHPFIAAFPVPEIDIVPSSLKVERVTELTTERGQMTQTSRSYSTAKMEGTSTSTTETETWNNWLEVSTYKYKNSSTRSISTLNTKKGVSFLDALGGLGTAIGIATGVKDLFQKDSGIWEKLGFTIRPGDDNCIVLEEDLKPEVEDLPLDDMSIGQNMNQHCPFGNAVGSSCISGEGWVVPQSPNNLYKASEFKTLSKDFLGQDKLSIGSDGNLLLNGKDPLKKESSLCFSQTQSFHTNSTAASEVPKISQINTQGSSRGGEFSTSHTEYEEHTVTNSEGFTTGEDWRTATALDSAHAADLWFTYKVRNTGTEYARQIGNLAFNLYIGDDPNPATTYFVAPDLGGSGLFQNFMPAEEHTYTGRRIPLSLEQMKAIDLGGAIRIVVEDFTYGIDELFYQQATNAGLLIAMEDGTDDGDERIDSYLLPTWGEENVVDVLARYFPHTVDENGTVIAIWTPEYRSDTPAWCAEPQVVGVGGQRTLWCKHALSTADWWNVYTNGLGDGAEGFQETPASPGAVALFRFNKDSDLDGYSDRSEDRLGTDPNDAGDFPRPELLAGVHRIRGGNHVTATLSLLNTGLYDAYGVEAVMIAPDASTNITNNTVGGSGRVRAQKQVIVGSRIALQTPLPTAWTQAGHAVPAAGGYYTDGRDRTYTFTVACGDAGGCTVGSGTWRVTWADSQGITGTLSYGDGYAAPTFLPVGAFGLTLALHSGAVANGESFTVTARTPRDTFQYTINHEPYTEPLIIVSYNDPQGNHRFIVPPSTAALTTPSDNLAPFSGKMLADVGVEIVTTEVFTGGATNTRLLVNNPSETTLIDANLFLEFINISGTVVSEVSTQVDLPPGPTTAAIPWDSAAFNPAYRATEDYIVMAFLTDYEGNILDTAGRPLSSFQDDPRPAAVFDNSAQVWDFGTVQQGTLLEQPFALASVGYLDLLAYLGNASGLTIDGPAATAIAPGDVAIYTVQLNTEAMPVGPYEATIPVRTSDPQNPTATLTIRGTITAMPGDAPGGIVIRPLDVDAVITGAHSQGEWVEFTHTLGPDPQSLHPVKVYSQDYGTLWGVGKYATDFNAGTASYDMFGDGRDGNINITTNTTDLPVDSACSGTAGSYTLSATNPSFAPDQAVLIHQTQGNNAGQWMRNKILAYSPGIITLAQPLNADYGTGAQVIVLKQFSNVTISSGSTWAAQAWNGVTGGILAFLANGSVIIEGAISTSGKGFRGGQRSAWPGYNYYSRQGEGTLGIGNLSESSNGNGGGGGYGVGGPSGGGGGGGNGAAGLNGEKFEGDYGYGGTSAGNAELTIMVPGGGGGAGADSDNSPEYGGSGGNGGGVIFIGGNLLIVSGFLTTNGSSGTDASWYQAGAGGGGAGGSVFIQSNTATLGSIHILAQGGAGGSGVSSPRGGNGGEGGVGRIRIQYCESYTGSTNPPASTQKLNCYMAEQLETTPYTSARLNLPASFTDGHTYKVQYGRRLSFPALATLTTTLRLPKQLYSDATLDAMVNNTGIISSPFTLSLDFGNDGTLDWTHNTTTTFPAMLHVTDTIDALNAYLVSRTDVAWGADVDVPVRVVSDRAADIILTNLVLRLQVNQPMARAATVESAADRPLDWPLSINGNYSQGAPYDFDHALGPDAATLQPCLVYDQSGKVLKGVGKYCTELGAGTASYDMFGDGRDGVMPSSGNLNDEHGAAIGTVNGDQGSTSITVVDRVHAYRINPGDVVLIHQTRGSGAGQWELNKAASDFTGSGTFVLQKPLNYHYISTSGNEKAQILRVPQYSTCNVTGTVMPLDAWNGDWGGIFAVMCSSAMNMSGSINASGAGFRGGSGGSGGSPSPGRHGYQGEGITTTGGYSQWPNTLGGGAGMADYASGDGGGGGGGGSYASPAQNGTKDSIHPNQDYGRGAIDVVGDSLLNSAYFGGGGGGGGTDDDTSTYGGHGGNGGGFILILSPEINGNGYISASGASGASGAPVGKDGGGGGGGGAGGSIKLVVGNLSVASISAAGGHGAPKVQQSGAGGSGGDGRIRIEYCTSLTSPTTPPASTQKLNCYVAEQTETAPYTTTRLYLPDAVSGSQSYLIQYGRRVVFAAPGEQSSSLRLNRRVYGGAELDLLVTNSGTAAGNLSLCLDLGNDGVCDYTHNAATNFPATLAVTTLAEALNSYLLSRNDVAWGDPVDVPVRLRLDRAADVMLTNLALTPLGAKTRFLRLDARTYQTATLGLAFRQPGVTSGSLAFTVDVGADGTVDWSYAGTPKFPAQLTSPNLATALNSYLAGRNGAVDVPLRIVPSPFLDLSLTDFDVTPADQPDLLAGTPAAATEPIEGATVPLTALIQNKGPAESGPLAVSFFATRTSPPAAYYIGTAFIPNVPHNASAPATIQWNTLGFPGDVRVQAVVDPFNRTAESNEANNSTTAPLHVRTRPDLHITAVALSNPLLMAGETVTVTLTLSNTGESAASAQRVALFNANPDDGGVLVGMQPDVALAGKTATTIRFPWTPSAPGLYRLFSVSDQGNAVNEYDEGNNHTWQDIYVGLAAPVLLDSGPGEPVYSPATGYGVIDEGQSDVFITCGSGVTREETQRLDFDGKLHYRFDHLLPGRFYHLDVTLYECTGAGRQESIYVDGNRVDGPVNLGDGMIHRRSLLLDPALYTDHAVDVTLEVPGVNGAIASAVNLYAIDYRYADSGGTKDPDYSAPLGYGALNGVRNAAWGKLPYQSVRVNQTGRHVTYRYDTLIPGRNYQLHLNFYQSGDNNRVQHIEIDGKIASTEVTLVNSQKQRISLAIPPESYADDHSISVSIVRTNADVGAIVNEIVLEEQTVPSAPCSAVTTPYWTQAYGSVTIADNPAPPGTVVTAENADGVIVGCFQVGVAGFYGFMPIFGGDQGSNPPIPGMTAGQQVKFRVDGSLAVVSSSLVWQNDKDIHRIDLSVTGIDSQWIRLNPGWTLFSLRVQPPVTALDSVLNSIQGAYCQIHGEADIYDCTLPAQTQGLTEIHGAQAYYLRNEGNATVNLLVQGTPITPTLPIPLHRDWNWVGYLLQENGAVGEALTSIAGKYIRVADGNARLYNPALPEFSTLTHLTPDNGYLIFVTEPATLVYPSTVAAATVDTTTVRNVCTEASPTPAFTWIYGDLLINGQPAPVGSRLEALTPNGELAGCFIVDRMGQYGFMPIYGADSGNPPLPGFLESEPLRLRVNGQDVVLSEPLFWHNDKQEHRVDLSVTVTEPRLFLPFVNR